MKYGDSKTRKEMPVSCAFCETFAFVVALWPDTKPQCRVTKADKSFMCLIVVEALRGRLLTYAGKVKALPCHFCHLQSLYIKAFSRISFRNRKTEKIFSLFFAKSGKLYLRYLLLIVQNHFVHDGARSLTGFILQV